MAKTPTLYTAGYERLDLATFVARVKKHKIDILIDTRAITFSRKPGFSKKYLSEAVRAIGTDYWHLDALGNPKPGRDAAKRGDTAEFHRIYLARLREPEAKVSIEYIRKMVIQRGKKVCLMCYERDPATCHRSLVAAAVKGVLAKDIIYDP